jgi:hypothetical protein
MDLDHLAILSHEEIIVELDSKQIPVIWVNAARRALPSLERMRNDTVLIISVVLHDVKLTSNYITDSIAQYMNMERDTIEIPSVHTLTVVFNFPGKDWQEQMTTCGEKVGEALKEILVYILPKS